MYKALYLTILCALSLLISSYNCVVGWGRNWLNGNWNRTKHIKEGIQLAFEVQNAWLVQFKIFFLKMERIGLPSFFPPQLTFFPLILWDFRRKSGARVYHPLEPAPLLSLPSTYSRRAPPLLHIRASVVFWIQTLNSHFLGGGSQLSSSPLSTLFILYGSTCQQHTDFL